MQGRSKVGTTPVLGWAMQSTKIAGKFLIHFIDIASANPTSNICYFV